MGHCKDCEAMEQPDSPGWWAFEGKWDTAREGTYFRSAGEVKLWDGILIVPFGDDWEPVYRWVGKWYRLSIPWDKAKEGA